MLLAPEDQLYEYGEEPPLTATVMLPLLLPLQETLVMAEAVMVMLFPAGNTITVAVLINVLQSLPASVTVTKYFPGASPVAVAVICPPGVQE